jgi:hypothetical protein
MFMTKGKLPPSPDGLRRDKSAFVLRAAARQAWFSEVDKRAEPPQISGMSVVPAHFASVA